MDFAAARQNMLDGQIKTNKVVDAAVLNAFARVPREVFLPQGERPKAYLDLDISIGSGRRMMQPMVLARLIQAAEPSPENLAMVAGAGTGYSAAILSNIVAKVIAVEENPQLLSLARDAISALGTANVRLVEGVASAGDRKSAPYDVILIDGAVSSAPQVLFDQLAEGGRLVAVLRESEAVGRAVLWRKARAGTSSRVLFDATAPFVPGFEPKAAFVF